MADDDDKQKKHTVESLFLVYCNFKVVPTEMENEEYDSILLSQIDKWLEQAKLMPVPFTRTQTGLAYMKFKKWRLEYEDFLELLQHVCNENQMNIQTVRENLVEAGAPVAGAEMVIVK